MKDKRIHFYAILMVMFFSVSVMAAPPPTLRFLTTDPLPDANKNTNYNYRVVVENSKGLVTFSIVNNPDLLPAGLSIDSSTGYITGIPTDSKKYDFIIRANDKNGQYDLSTSITTSDNGDKFGISTNSLADGKIAQAYTCNLTVLGGTGPFIYITSGLPVGLSLDGETGVISGIPGEAGTFFMTITVRDTHDDTQAVSVLPLTVLPSTSSFRFTSLIFDNGTVDSNYNDNYETSGGIGNVSYSVTGLPPGLSYDSSSGTVTGRPTVAGSYLVTVKANDGSKTIAIQQRIIIVQSATSNFFWDFVGLPSATIGIDYAKSRAVPVVTENGGTVTYSVTGLPAGMTYDADKGELSGTPTGPLGVYPLVFTATDTTPEPDETITLKAELSVMGIKGGDLSSLTAQFFVLSQSFKSGVPGSDSWSATILYNADRTAGNAFDPVNDDFHLDLGNAEIDIPKGNMVAQSPVLFTYQNVPTDLAPRSVSVKIYGDKQQIKIKTSHDTLTDIVPDSLLNSLDLGGDLGRIKEYIGNRGKFTVFTGYRNIGFAASKVKITRIVDGLDSAQLQLYLASPGFTYAAGDTVKIRLLDDTSTEMLNRDYKDLITVIQKVDSATQSTVYSMRKTIDDVALADVLNSFKYDNKKRKMDIKLSCLDLSPLAAAEENLTIEVTIGKVVYSVTLTIFDPEGEGKYTEIMPH